MCKHPIILGFDESPNGIKCMATMARRRRSFAMKMRRGRGAARNDQRDNDNGSVNGERNIFL